ncbi:MAG: nucleotidyl transferase AbiEii/AbiGii toxin family protein [Anaerolineales bacterium]|nr:nucleotidyl transferase AbiEii/AbiGii toxin family protein [Anaerolineales bacterium]
MNASFALQDRFLERFFAGPLAEHFYLTGGTALARFYFHHRESMDLDLFTNDFGQDFAQVNQTVLGILHALELQITSQVVTDTFIQYIMADQVGVSLKVDLVKDVPVHFGDLLTRGGVRLDSLENIGANKILAVFGRTDAKDFIDLYWILHHTELKFEQLFQQAKQKDLGLSEFYLAYALQNVEKIRLFPRMLLPLPWEEVKAYFQAIARELLNRIKPN